MLAHKADSENQACYSDLFLATQNLERRAEARDPVPPQTALTSGLNVICSHTPGNLFPSCKLKATILSPLELKLLEMMRVKQCKAVRRRRDGTLSWWWGLSIRWSERNRSDFGVYHSFCQDSWTIPTEKQKLVQMWESWPFCVGLPERH